MIAPGFESHQCFAGMWKRRLSCQEVSRCHNRGKSQGMCNIHLNTAQIRLPTLALKPRGEVTRSPKTGVSVAPQKGLMSSKNFKKINFGPYGWCMPGVLPLDPPLICTDSPSEICNVIHTRFSCILLLLLLPANIVCFIQD